MLMMQFDRDVFRIHHHHHLHCLPVLQVLKGVPITNPSIFPLALIGDENFRLYDLSAFVEIKRTIVTAHLSLIYPSSEAYSFINMIYFVYMQMIFK
jgi:hypothetical protein